MWFSFYQYRMSAPFCPSLTDYQRFTTRVVHIGDVAMGGQNPIVVQSMTTTDTMDTAATVAQTIRLIEAGCEIVRITAPSLKEAENLANIKKELKNRGYSVPLVADIHFTPNAAEVAARIVEKVRINPGNFVDKKKFEQIDYTDASYEAELERIRQKFIPLVKICKEYGTAMRIGTNHGSLSDRIMSRYGDTPLGMVESAMEFLRIAREFDFHQIVLSMKASNPQVMVQAYRQLVSTMMQHGMDYPLHLGVTEAGDGEDGRIKSAVGIGTLLEDGLGDTVRVSLTEEPEFEIPVARALVDRYKNRKASRAIPALREDHDFLHYAKRATHEVLNFGGKHVPPVIADLSTTHLDYNSLKEIGYFYDEPSDKWHLADQTADAVLLHQMPDFTNLPTTLMVLVPFQQWQAGKHNCFPILNKEEFVSNRPEGVVFLKLSLPEMSESLVDVLKKDKSVILILESDNDHAMPELRRLYLELQHYGITTPTVVHRSFSALDLERSQLAASTDAGALFLDGFGEGILLGNPESHALAAFNSLAFGILQATRLRISKTEYIACPSCGRTLFDLQETTAKIRKRTSHLKGVKIGIMGCIVNGPGEMADADYGYVGSGPGKITLYKGKEIVKRNIPSTGAVDALVDLIRQHGDWIEPANIVSN